MNDWNGFGRTFNGLINIDTFIMYRYWILHLTFTGDPLFLLPSTTDPSYATSFGGLISAKASILVVLVSRIAHVLVLLVIRLAHQSLLSHSLFAVRLNIAAFTEHSLIQSRDFQMKRFGNVVMPFALAI